MLTVCDICRDPLKGMVALRAAGLVESSAESAAAFLRKNNAALDKGQLGQYLGHGNANEVTTVIPSLCFLSVSFSLQLPFYC